LYSNFKYNITYYNISIVNIARGNTIMLIVIINIIH